MAAGRDTTTQPQDVPGEPEGAHRDTASPPAKPQPCSNTILGQQQSCRNHITPCLPWHTLTVWEHQGCLLQGDKATQPIAPTAGDSRGAPAGSPVLSLPGAGWCNAFRVFHHS